MSPLLKKILRNTLFVSIGALLLWWAFKGVPLSKIVDDIKSAKISWLLLAALAGILSHVFRALRWQQVLEPLGYNLGLKNSFIGVMIGYVVNFAFPRAGEVSRCVMVNRTDKIPVQTLLGTIVAERIIDVVMLVVSISLAVILQFDIFSQLVQNGPVAEKVNGFVSSGPKMAILIGGLLAITLVIYLLRHRIRASKPYQKFKGLINGFAIGLKSVLKVRNKPLFVLYTLLMWVCYFLLPYLTFFSFAPTSNLSAATGLTVTALGAVSIAAPAPGGIGLFHRMIASALTLFGLTYDDGLSYATIAHGVQMILIFLVGAVCFALVIIDENKRKPQKVKNEETISQ